MCPRLLLGNWQADDDVAQVLSILRLWSLARGKGEHVGCAALTAEEVVEAAHLRSARKHDRYL